MTLCGEGLVLTACAGAPWLRALLDRSLSDGMPFRCTVPLEPGLGNQLTAFNAQARLLAGELPPTSARGTTRSALLHLRALQAIDAAQAGSRHRDIAETLFGVEAVRERWSADGELRANVRHLLARAQGFVLGGYLDLAGVRRSVEPTPGDEPGP